MTEKLNRRPGQGFLFALNFFKHPNMLGWFLPSSRFMVNRVLRQIDWPNARVIVEYGPGVGTFTSEILRRMRPDATLLAIETNPEFVEFLRGFVRDDRLRIVEGSAEHVRFALAKAGHTQADYVISGIPFKTLPVHLREPIVRATHSVLHSGGSFLVYQMSRAVLPYLEKFFDNVAQDFEPLNILPGRLFYCSVPRCDAKTSAATQKSPLINGTVQRPTRSQAAD